MLWMVVVAVGWPTTAHAQDRSDETFRFMLEGRVGGAFWTDLETPDGDTFDPNSSLDPGLGWGGSLALGVYWLMFDITLLRSSGQLNTELTQLDPDWQTTWTQTSWMLGLRTLPLSPLPGLEVGASTGLGLTWAQMRLDGRSMPLEELMGISWFLGARAHMTLIAGLYTGVDVRWLWTGQWRNAEDSPQGGEPFDGFQANPLWVQLCVGYRFSVTQ